MLRERTEVICCANAKGGDGKTTTARNLAIELASRGYSVGGVDFDPQANFSLSLGILPNELETTTSEIFKEFFENHDLDEMRSMVSGAIITKHGIDVLPSNIGLARTSRLFLGERGSESLLKILVNVMKDLKDYDFIIIDSPPAIGVLVDNILVASDKIIFCIQPHLFSMSGTQDLLDEIANVKAYINPSLDLIGAHINQYSKNAVEEKKTIEAIRKFFGKRCFNSMTRKLSVFRSANSKSISVKDCFPGTEKNKRAVKDLDGFVSEFIERLDNE